MNYRIKKKLGETGPTRLAESGNESGQETRFVTRVFNPSRLTSDETGPTRLVTDSLA